MSTYNGSLGGQGLDPLSPHFISLVIHPRLRTRLPI